MEPLALWQDGKVNRLSQILDLFRSKTHGINDPEAQREAAGEKVRVQAIVLVARQRDAGGLVVTIVAFLSD